MRKLFVFGLSCFLICFILGTVVWFGFENKKQSVEKIDQTFEKNAINQIVINVDATNIKMVPSDYFHISYEGKQEMKVSKQSRVLTITEMNRSGIRTPNLNPFNNLEGQLEIGIPPAQLKEVDLTSNIGAVNIENVDIDHASIWNGDSGELNIRNSQLTHSKFSANETLVNIENSRLDHSEFNIEQGKINGEKTLLKNSIFKLNRGDIHLQEMLMGCDFKGSVKDGNIYLGYRQPPTDVMLSLNPEKGKAIINNDQIKKGKNGKGTHQIELYTTRGDITVE
ncbi:DUF4097 family beta strand repeat-containing protein [Staphylococcus intermedius]|uniref:Exported protein n=1 Tax=Staphylococcus intermedius NCTC 11048 TaxID=1141106 RepID=A0A380G7A3_STAIN|nr:DUF4097 family beta strand repeat-containing protein [Staphylococcus intermedius]PCF63193.1 hypothetical protein B5C04_10755 [Staphylococcus intermedius]PCF78085.1 hypothetical protein B4W74_11110 [Staphylococcus intermedius]PCF79170.1 hypothetical protein B4W70_10750 [Staphylococcus intermedius]PCF85469.1 hypothetical protein B4W76_09855 [Staphylococcus intermedius]PCF86535.1 hypothetical protein B4W75_10135 [Staphylococcus intermedius]